MTVCPVQATSSLYLFSLSLSLFLSKTHTPAQTHTHWLVFRVSDRVQTKPFLLLPPSPSPYHRLPLFYAITLRCPELVTGAPGGQRSVKQWQLTIDSLSQRHQHTTLICFPSFFTLTSFSFLTSSLFLWLRLLTQAIYSTVGSPRQPAAPLCAQSWQLTLGSQMVLTNPEEDAELPCWRTDVLKSSWEDSRLEDCLINGLESIRSSKTK